MNIYATTTNGFNIFHLVDEFQKGASINIGEVYLSPTGVICAEVECSECAFSNTSCDGFTKVERSILLSLFSNLETTHPELLL